MTDLKTLRSVATKAARRNWTDDDMQDFEDAFHPVAVLSLLDRVEALEADKARLDFLDEANTRLNAKYGTTYRWKLIMNHNVNRLMIGHLDVDLNDAEPNALKSCRDAIDERMREVGAARATLKDTPNG